MGSKPELSLPVKVRRQHMLENIPTGTFTPREYQVEILDAARKKNVIACLGTGAGKTFIAVMLIKELSNQVREDFENGGKRTIFLAPTVPLVKQQKQVIEDYTDLKVCDYCGKQEKQASLKEFWQKELKNTQVLVMTPDIFRMLVNHALLPLSKINLLIIDECHRARKAHPYREVMRCFDLCPPDEWPRILGLSASLLNNKCKPVKLESEIQTLENTLRSVVVTASDLVTTDKYSTKPQEKTTFYDNYTNSSSIFENIMSSLNKSLRFITDIDIKPKEDDIETELEKVPDPCKQPRRYLLVMQQILTNLGLWCANETAELFMTEISRMLDTIESEKHRRMLILVNTTLKMVSNLCKELANNDQLPFCSSPKLEKLLKILKPFKPAEENLVIENSNNSKDNNCSNNVKNVSMNSNKNQLEEKLETGNTELKKHSMSNEKSIVDDSKALCGILFVKERITAHVLHLWLTEMSNQNKDYKFISSSFIFGHNQIQRNCATKESSMALRKQEEILQKFRNKEYNLLIATSVVEEGLDVPKCNLVVRFDRPEEFRSYIQSKGRARAQDSLYYIMVSKTDKQKFMEDMTDFKTIEMILQKKCHNRENPTENEIADEFADKMKDAYMPVPKEGGPRVQMSSAIALVNRDEKKTASRKTGQKKFSNKFTTVKK